MKIIQYIDRLIDEFTFFYTFYCRPNLLEYIKQIEENFVRL